MYVTLPTEQSVRTYLRSELAICILGQALYPVKHVTWCVYALFIDSDDRIREIVSTLLTKYQVTELSVKEGTCGQ